MSKLFQKLTDRLEINHIKNEAFALSESEKADVETKVIFQESNSKTAELLEMRSDDGSDSE